MDKSIFPNSTSIYVGIKNFRSHTGRLTRLEQHSNLLSDFKPIWEASARTGMGRGGGGGTGGGIRAYKLQTIGCRPALYYETL